MGATADTTTENLNTNYLEVEAMYSSHKNHTEWNLQLVAENENNTREQTLQNLRK